MSNEIKTLKTAASTLAQLKEHATSAFGPIWMQISLEISSDDLDDAIESALDAAFAAGRESADSGAIQVMDRQNRDLHQRLTGALVDIAKLTERNRELPENLNHPTGSLAPGPRIAELQSLIDNLSAELAGARAEIDRLRAKPARAPAKPQAGLNIGARWDSVPGLLPAQMGDGL